MRQRHGSHGHAGSEPYGEQRCQQAADPKADDAGGRTGENRNDKSGKVEHARGFYLPLLISSVGGPEAFQDAAQRAPHGALLIGSPDEVVEWSEALAAFPGSPSK
jgi:hypothetical protein